MSSFVNGPGGALSANVRRLVYFPTENARRTTNEWQDPSLFHLSLDWKDACELVGTRWTSLTDTPITYDTDKPEELRIVATLLLHRITALVQWTNSASLSTSMKASISVEMQHWLGDTLDTVMQTANWQANHPFGWYPALLSITALIERFLGDLVYTQKHNRSSETIPFLLRDLLLVPSLVDLLGNELILLLRVLIGPPSGMNLRNIVWHGFLDASFSDCGRCYVVLLLAVFMQIAQYANGKIDQVQRRPYVDLLDYYNDPISLTTADHHQQQHNSINDWIAILDNDMMRDDLILCHSINVKLYSPGEQQLYSTISIVPLLEHTLRKYWIDSNQLPVERCCTADSKQFYCILDDILSSTIHLDETIPPKHNLLGMTLSEPVMDLLMDLFVYPKGPRIRDRLAHGEVNWPFTHTLPAGIDALAQTIQTALIAVLLSKKHHISSSSSDVVLLDYQSRFHPLVNLRKAINNGKTSLNRLLSLEAMMENTKHATSTWKTTWDLAPLHTLWRPASQVRLAIGTMEPLVNGVTMIADKLYDSLSINTTMTTTKTLSTRRRRQHARLAQMAPLIICSLWRLLSMVADWLSVVGDKSALMVPILDDNTTTCGINEALARQLRTLIDQCQSYASQGHWERIHDSLLEYQIVDDDNTK